MNLAMGDGQKILQIEKHGDPLSPGPVANHECVVRGAFEDDRLKANAAAQSSTSPYHPFKQALVPAGQLRRRQYSVFRDLGDLNENKAEIVATIRASKPDQTLMNILWTGVRGIRTVMGPEGSKNTRCFVVIDNVEKDAKGGKHRLHANIGYTDEYETHLGNADALDDPPAVYARRSLTLLLKQNIETFP